jgi:glucosylceramidase
VKIFAGDDQRYIFPRWFKSMQSSFPTSMDYVDGFAVHWYWDRVIPVHELDETHRLFPNKIIMNTESCMGDNPLDGRGPHIGSWRRGELYARDIIKARSEL